MSARFASARQHSGCAAYSAGSWKVQESFYGGAPRRGKRFADEHEQRTDTKKLKC